MMHKVRLMGVLNVTRDSFYEQSRFPMQDSAIQRGLEICADGADILDIGGESTRPGADFVSKEEELSRVIPVITALKEKIQTHISIDTYKPDVAAAAIEAGASIINDVSGFRNPEMQEIASHYEVEVCLMHMQGTPKTMQHNPYYPEGIISHLLQYFDTQIALLLNKGVKPHKIILDPGIGFGKTVADNFEIIQNIYRIKALGFPVLVGLSRKSFMSTLLNRSTSNLLPATVAMNTAAILAGADLIRVHDVREHYDAIKVLSQLTSPTIPHSGVI
jgi:dihydropteroate synthase